jgi:polygalacturonase
MFPAGRYLSGTVVLKSHVTLQLEAGAVLLGSKSLEDYPSHVPALRSYTDTYTEKSLIYAENAENIGIRGTGTIDGQGAAFHGPYKVRPYLIRFINCRGVSTSDVTIVDSPMWVQHYLACDHVDIRGVTVHSRVNANNDGIDIDGCQGVRIADCEIWSGDDAIVLKATLDRPCRDVVITNCVLSTLCNALKLGTESNGGFDNIAISNCTIRDTRLAGIAIEMVDGGVLERVSISNITMSGVGTPLFVRLGNRARPFVEGGAMPGMGSLRNVSISNVQADGAGKTGCAIAGLPGHAIENLTLDNIRMSFAGGGKASDATRSVPEKPEGYPEHSMFGTLPAYGLYCRHVKNLRVRDVRTEAVLADARPAVFCDDVEGVELADCALSAVRMTQARDVFVHGCRTVGAPDAWLRVGGAESRQIHLLGNRLTMAKRAVEVESEVAANTVTGDVK